MPIYRGSGGSGNSNTSANANQVAIDAAAAAQSATDAAASAAAALVSENEAESAETNAEISETNASNSATASANSATASSNSATASAASATLSDGSATASSDSATASANSATAAANSETASNNSETAAANSATSAANSASSAAGSATSAGQSASMSSASANASAINAVASANSANASAASAAAAQAAQEAIDGLYLGAQSSDPTLDLNGDPVTVGDWYFNTTINKSKIYNGSGWDVLTSNGSVTSVTGAGTVNGVTLTGTVTTAGNLTLGGTLSGITASQLNSQNISQWTNDSGYLTSYTETDTLDSVTDRGATTTNDVTVGNLTSTGIDDNATSTAVTIDSIGNVGLGADPVAAKLHVKSQGNLAAVIESVNTKSYLSFLTSETTSANETFIGLEDDNEFIIKTGAATAVTIDSSQNVTFSEEVLSDKLRINGVAYSSNQDTAYLIAGTTGWTGATTNWNTYGFQHKIKTDAGGVVRLTIDTHLGEKFSLFNNGNFTFAGNGTFNGTTNTFTNSLIVGSTLTFNGGTSNNHLVFPDLKEIRFGANDLRIYHDGTYNRILSSAPQPLLIAGQGIWLTDYTTGEDYVRTTPNGTVQLYYDGAEKIKTTSTGVDVTGSITSTGGNSLNWNTAYLDTATATSAFTGNKLAKRDANGSCKFRDLWIDRNDNTGALYFGDNAGGRYLYYTGSNYQFANAPILASTGTSTFGGISSTGAIVSTKGADAIQIYNGSTQVGQIEATDTTWLRINQDVGKNIYTPRYIRADAGFFVDGTAKGINGDGNYIGGTVTCTAITNSGSFVGRTNTSTVFNSSNDTGSMSVRGDTTHPAVISFHRAGAYAVNFGLDGTNMKLGGWSAVSTKFQWNMANGDFHADGNVIAYSTTVSDERLKDDVQLITSALDTVDSLRGVTYTWNAGSRKGKRDYGVIAQEVEKVIPEIVHETTMPLINGDEETIYKTVDYEKLCAVLINAVSELRAEVEALKNGSSD